MRDRSVAVVLGTRPEIVKLAPVVRALGAAARAVHSGQHLTAAMSRDLLTALGVSDPDRVSPIAGLPRAEQIAVGAAALADAFSLDRPDAVVVQGDTNTTLAGALAANALHIPLVHVEAGLRSDDLRMPEERNRILTDHLAVLCCAPTEHARARLVAEGIPSARAPITGNPVVDAVRMHLPGPAARASILAAHGLVASGFVLATFHRPENVDDVDALGEILRGLGALALPVVFPVHPRTAARAAEHGLDPARGALCPIDPLGFAEFLALEAECAFVVSDSGGVQEEVSVLGRPVLVVRSGTERPEVLGTFATLVDRHEIAERASEWTGTVAALHERLAGIPTPYGDGHAGERIAAEVRALLRD